MGNDLDHVIFFDGVCGLCNGYVRFLLKRDRGDQFHVAPLKGQTAEELLPEELLQNTSDTIIYREVTEETTKFYTRSTAILKILSNLGGPWILAGGLRIIPSFIRDALYDFIASNRYDWFGRYDSCPAPEPEWRDRFLD